MDELFLQGVTALVTIAGTTLAINNYLNNRFSKLTSEVSLLVRDQAVDSIALKLKMEKIESDIEDIVLYRINANTELINHRTKRFDELLQKECELNIERVDAIRIQLKESTEIVLGKIVRVDEEIGQIQQFLANSSGFKIRK